MKVLKKIRNMMSRAEVERLKFAKVRSASRQRQLLELKEKTAIAKEKAALKAAKSPRTTKTTKMKRSSSNAQRVRTKFLANTQATPPKTTSDLPPVLWGTGGKPPMFGRG